MPGRMTTGLWFCVRRNSEAVLDFAGAGRHGRDGWPWLSGLPHRERLLDACSRAMDTQERLQILADASGQPLESINRDTDRDFYLNAKEAIAYGLADRIVDKV